MTFSPKKDLKMWWHCQSFEEKMFGPFCAHENITQTKTVTSNREIQTEGLFVTWDMHLPTPALIPVQTRPHQISSDGFLNVRGRKCPTVKSGAGIFKLELNLVAFGHKHARNPYYSVPSVDILQGFSILWVKVKYRLKWFFKARWPNIQVVG